MPDEPPVEAIQGEARAREVLIQSGMHEDADRATGFVPYAVAIRAMLAFQSEARAVPSGGEREASGDLIARIDAEIERITGFHPAKQILADCRARLSLPHREAIAREVEPLARLDVKAIWKAHGGSQHGPNVEQYYIEEQAFYRFASAYRDAILALSPTPSATLPPATEKAEK